ncbi:MAG: T9SS type A sorting domain-containing protein [Bacteroidota bacterium]
MVEGAAGAAAKTVWEQGVIVSPGTAYTFYTDFYPDLTSGSQPILQFFINDQAVGSTIEGQSGQWRTYAVNWTAPEGSISANLQIRKVGSNGGTNDFGIDNVRFEFCLDDVGGTPDDIDNIGIDKVVNNSVRLMAIPNPFVETTTIQFDLPKQMPAAIHVFNIDGTVVFTQEGNFQAGRNTVDFRAAAHLATGVYYYRLETAEQSQMQTMILMRR